MMKKIVTEKAPGAIGPYCQGVVHGDLVITSGQIPVDPKTGFVPEGIARQAEQSCQNVGAVLEAGGSDLPTSSRRPVFLPVWMTLLPLTKSMASILSQTQHVVAFL